MGQITSLFAWKVVEEVDAGADRAGLLRSVGIDPERPVDPSQMIPDAEYYGLFERCAAVDSRGWTLPLRVGSAMSCADYGAFGLAWKSATDLRGSYARAERYARVLTSVSTYEVERVDGGAFMHLHRDGERRLGLRLSNEATIASVLAISREASSEDVRPLEVHFKHEAPRSTAEHETIFGCPTRFESDRDALLVSDEALQTPNKVGDEGIVRFFDTVLHADVLRLGEEPSLASQVRNRISQSLSEGVPTVSDVAGHLAMSARTLQRRLADQGLTYQGLVDQARQRLAQRLLRETAYSMIEIAFMTGFAEQSSFNRAFRRWEGQTPRSYRLGSS